MQRMVPAYKKLCEHSFDFDADQLSGLGSSSCASSSAASSSSATVHATIAASYFGRLERDPRVLGQLGELLGADESPPVDVVFGEEEALLVAEADATLRPDLPTAMADAAPAESELSPMLRVLPMAAGGASAQSAALGANAELNVPAESEPSLLLPALTGDPLRAIAQLLGDAKLPCFRLVCRAFRNHSSPAQKKCRVDFLRTRALTVFAWESMPGFVAGLLTLVCLAVCVGNLEVLEELVDNRQCPLTLYAYRVAAGKGQLGALAWLRSRGCQWASSTCADAANGEHYEVLRYAHEHGCPWDQNTCRSAAAGGHLEVLRYAHEHGCPWDSDTFSTAAAGRHLEMLQYLHEHGCPWDSSICNHAAGRGHIEVLRYLHEHGYPWGSDTCYGAALGGHLEVLRYAHEQGCPWDALTWQRGNLDMLRYAHEHGCPLGRDTCWGAALEWHLEVLRYAHEHGCP
ncbi:hypothetical protein T492DRAFT_908154 [Pavlovales sp. CCMP2436]|nr:hypothetical protein T492DRAFT_908154 [Pavlovales sp. CCMP2436]